MYAAWPYSTLYRDYSMGPTKVLTLDPHPLSLPVILTVA